MLVNKLAGKPIAGAPFVVRKLLIAIKSNVICVKRPNLSNFGIFKEPVWEISAKSKIFAEGAIILV